MVCMMERLFTWNNGYNGFILFTRWPEVSDESTEPASYCIDRCAHAWACGMDIVSKRGRGIATRNASCKVTCEEKMSYAATRSAVAYMITIPATNPPTVAGERRGLPSSSL